ncbi:hypothetical protein [Candidatus Pelagibacter sp. HIMB1321]|uniref:hypothetical protein n=1 Tax=Candidatus Pelagibacter sp. HIMB1321 TaxID=1388755 RepID=UPI000A0809A0|nr:hypothetical protein [Candidatus Pelagibacter sp. HIMB1321]SMF77961.1 OmpA-like transmembrane domain-containing protein [Candidatus Pelagibacter sp. HIMB1321]
MKKILTSFFSLLLLTSSAFAGGMIGIKAGVGELEGNKKSYTAGSNTYTAQSASEDSEYAAIFAEVNLGESPVSVGLEYIPYTATVSVDHGAADSHLELSDHTTLYLLASKELSNGASVYGKLGYSMADIGGVKANFDGTTVNSHDDSLEGPMAGIGIQSTEFSQLGLIARLEATYTEYDEVKVNTTSNGSASVDKKADAELTTFTISIAKPF